MEFSILFKEKEKELNELELPFFRDLKLDQIRDAIYISENDKYLIPYFNTPLDNLDDIKYRQDMFSEFLAKKEFYTEIKYYFIHLYAIYNAYKENIEDNDTFVTKAKRLKIMDEYTKTLSELDNFLKDKTFKSLALTRVKEWVNNYLNGEEFKKFQEAVKYAKGLMKGIEFSILFKGSEVFVDVIRTPLDDDFAPAVNNLCSIFDYPRDKKIASDVPFAPTNKVDEEIYNKLARIFKKEFKAILEFFGSYKEFYNPFVLKLAKEMRFYFTYIAMMDKIKNSYLSFSIPFVSDSYDETSTDSFDLALAWKFNIEKRVIVTNSFDINTKKRIMVLTGPNQGGKTTFARQLGQVHYLAKLGVPVQGINNKIHLIDNIYTFFKTEENLESLDGKLQIELNATKEILDKSTNDSLILFNEIFASTTMVDGLDISNLILNKINKMGSLCLFVTFLTDLAKRDDVMVLSSNVDPDNNEIRTFKITKTLLLGSAYPSSIQAKYGLTYDKIRKELEHED